MSNTSNPSRSLNWYEIPVTDLPRAVRFYETVLGRPLRTEVFAGEPMAVFPYTTPAVGGALVGGPHRRPGADGAILYLDATGQLDAALERAATAGGAVLTPRTPVGPAGFIGLVRDTEGNTVGLHSPT